MMTGEPDLLYSEFLDDFYAECEEHLKAVRRILLALEPFASHLGADPSLLEELFRHLHTLKGLSAMVGLTPAEQLAHQMESLLRLLRADPASLDLSMLDTLMDGVQELEQVVAVQQARQPLPNPAAVLDRLSALLAPALPASAPAPPSPMPVTPVTAAPDELTDRLEAVRRDGAMVWRFQFSPSRELADRGVTVEGIRARLQEAGEILSATPRVEPGGQIVFEFLVATTWDESTFRDWQDDGLSGAPYEPFSAAAPPPESGAGSWAPTLSSGMVRVELSRLDDLMRKVGDLVISRARLEGKLRDLEKTVPTAQWRALQEVNTALERQLRDLREGVMRVRLVPIGEVFERMQFVVRDLARERGQRVILELSGQETEVDKLVVERMADPLLHLVRNAVSHGLEPAEERLARGKPAEGRIGLRASTAGDRVVIVVEDDGRGVDRQAVAAQARELGWFEADEFLDDQRLLEILCSPGFSTRQEADRVSGRGVGMSVVKNAVENLGGTLTLDTEVGRGTRFVIQLPLTLAIVDALLVSVGGQTFAVPLPAVQEVLEIAPEEITSMAQGREEMIPYWGGVLPLVRLADRFGLETRFRRAFHAFVVGWAPHWAGIVVDRVLGQREIVVHAVADPLVQQPGIAGATELGDGRPILILDATALARIGSVG
ncbi:MAG: chemotaxis protein CheA [Anaerolineae bacterium]